MMTPMSIPLNADAVVRDLDQLIAENERLRRHLNAIRQLFAGGPDTPCRTTWPDGTECVEIPMADLRRVFDGGGDP